MPFVGIRARARGVGIGEVSSARARGVGIGEVSSVGIGEVSSRGVGIGEVSSDGKPLLGKPASSAVE